jgi:quercetin dioxygenase-like cupin family protein
LSDPLFPDFIRALPTPESPLTSLRGWLLGGGAAPLAMFYEIPDGVEVPEHAHGAQWGVVLEGRVDFTVEGEERTYVKGDSYYISAGARHRALIHPGFAGIDVFADGDRYRQKPASEEREG